MSAVLAYGACLLVAVLVSDLARRSVVSTAVLFLFAGIGGSWAGLLPLHPREPLVTHLAELALVVVLFTDGTRTGASDLARRWRLPARALLVAMPLTAGATALLARWLVGLSWLQALLVAAALGPTDPVFAAGLVGSERVPGRLRNLLNVESGLNDGLAVPAVLLLLGALGAAGEAKAPAALVRDILLGAGVGAAVPPAAVGLARLPVFSVAPLYRPLFGLSVLLVVYPLAVVIGANHFLAAFAAGVATATVSDRARDHFRPLGEQLSELLKLAALLVFGALISGRALVHLGWGCFLFAALALLLARPLAMAVALLGSALTWKERLVAGWFGPKGFASVVFGLLILRSQLPARGHLFHVIALVVICSVIAHSSTDVLASRWFGAERHGRAPGHAAPSDRPVDRPQPA